MSPTILVILRGIISFTTLLILARLLGKQQVGQLTFFEYITGITIGSLAAQLTADLEVRAWLQFVAVLVWAVLTFIVQWVTMRNRKIASYLSGEPMIVVHNGHILEENMQKNRYRFDELLMQLRHQGIFNVKDVALAVLENNGQLSVMKRTAGRAKQPDISTEQSSTVLVQEGRLMMDNVKKLGLDPAWVMDELRRKGAPRLEQVTIAVMSPAGDIYVDKYEDPSK